MSDPEQCNRLIAEKVMGWVWIELLGGWDTGSHILADMVFKRDWDPYHNPTHAHMALEKFINEHSLDVTIEKDWNSSWWCFIGNLPFGGPKEKEVNCKGSAATPSAAICEAIAEAVKGESDE